MTTLSEPTARFGRGLILTMSIGGLAMVFQPFSLALFSIGCGTVFLAAIAFNLMPVLQAGQPWPVVFRAARIILTVLAVMVSLAVLAAYLYVLYLQN